MDETDLAITPCPAEFSLCSFHHKKLELCTQFPASNDNFLQIAI